MKQENIIVHGGSHTQKDKQQEFLSDAKHIKFANIGREIGGVANEIWQEIMREKVETLTGRLMK